jgi:hypothetical protein
LLLQTVVQIVRVFYLQWSLNLVKDHSPKSYVEEAENDNAQVKGYCLEVLQKKKVIGNK